MLSKEVILQWLTEAVSGTDKELYTDEELDKFATFYVDKWDDITSEDVIAESFVDFYWGKHHECRRCSECGRLFREGFVDGGGHAYFCSKECRRNVYTDEEWERECEEDDQSYYTEFY